MKENTVGPCLNKDYLLNFRNIWNFRQEVLKLAAHLLLVRKLKDKHAKISPWILPPHLSWWPCWGWAAAARWAKTGNTPLTDHCSGTKMLRCRGKNTEPSSGWQTWWSLVNSTVNRENIHCTYLKYGQRHHVSGQSQADHHENVRRHGKLGCQGSTLQYRGRPATLRVHLDYTDYLKNTHTYTSKYWDINNLLILYEWRV